MGLAQSSIGSVVTVRYIIPDDNPIANATDKIITGSGYFAARVPHHVKKLVMLFSKLAPILSNRLRSAIVILVSGGSTT